MDLIALGLVRDGHPLERVAPRTWAWKGETADQPSLLPTMNGQHSEEGQAEE